MFQVLFDEIGLCVVPGYRGGDGDLARWHLTLLNICDVPIPVTGISGLSTGCNLYSIDCKLFLCIEYIVGASEGHIEVFAEQGLVIGAYLDAKVQNLDQETALEGLWHVLGLSVRIKLKKVGPLFVMTPYLLVAEGQFLVEGFLEVATSEELVFSDLGVQ